MFPILIILSIGVFSIVLFVASALFWLSAWRARKSGTAHGLFLTNFALALVVFFKVIQILSGIVEDGEMNYPYNIASAFFMMFVAIFQFALSRGYFNYKE